MKNPDTLSNVTRILADVEKIAQRGPYAPTWASLENYRIPAWYKDAKFGIFIHWGVYCVPAFGNEWYPRQMYVQGSKEFEHHVATYGPQDKFGYKDFIPQLTAAKFDAGQWAELFRKAGAKFVVPVAEHHDGFAMYDTCLSRWKASAMGPKRDIIGELSKAVRARNMIFGLSSHRAEHWWFFDGGRAFASDVTDPANLDFYGPAQPKDSQPDKAYLDNWLARTCELVAKYSPQIVWFDWWIEEPAFAPYLKKFSSYYYNWAKQQGTSVAINYKNQAYPPDAAVYDVERGQLKSIRPILWQTDTAVSKNSWGYIAAHDYKPVTSIIHDLVDIVSKNGVLLLNIGPKPDGTIPQPEQDMLLDIGRWLASNGEAIYGTRPWKRFGEGPTEIIEGTFMDVKRAAFTAQDIRFTAREDTIYAIVLGQPADGKVKIASLAEGVAVAPDKIAAIELLGGAAVKWSRNREALTVELPEGLSVSHALALRITPKAA